MSELDIHFDDDYSKSLQEPEPVEEELTTEPVEEELTPEPVEEEPITIIVEEELTPEPVEEEPISEPVEEELTPEPVEEEPITIIVEEEPISEPVEEEPISEPVEEEPITIIVEEELTPEPVEEVTPEPVEEEPIPEPVEEEPIPGPQMPQIIFIVPYRDRESHYKIFSSHMNTILQNSPPYKILYIHQNDKRSFNRGAMKNIGFLAVKEMYPNTYTNITLVFNDIDTMPAKDTVLNYATSRGIIKHFYGFTHTLGGIVSINALDFERLNGFPNFWAWGYEDNLLQMRAEKEGIQIDRSVFYKIHDPAIIHLVDTPIREVNRGEYDRFLYRTQEGISSIQDLNWSILSTSSLQKLSGNVLIESSNSSSFASHCVSVLRIPGLEYSRIDDQMESRRELTTNGSREGNYNVEDDTVFINVFQFNTSDQEMLEKRTNYDLRNGPVPFKAKKPQRRNPSMKMHF